MTRKIFILGATGYIGGDALFAIVKAHPDYEIFCLVRNSEKGAEVASQYSNVRLVYGGLDDEDILRQEAMKADIVLNCAHADHGAAVTAIVQGLGSHPNHSTGYYIHTSGSGILMVRDTDRKILGEASSKIYDDWEGIGEVTSLPDHASHRMIDKAVIAADGPDVMTAIVCPPTIYGPGRGPGNQRSHQIPEMTRCALEKKQAFQVDAGENSWSTVHVHDLSEIYVKLIGAATDEGSKATWGQHGYYFAENGEHVWGHTANNIAKKCFQQGFLPTDTVVSIHENEADAMTNSGAVLWGANSRCRAVRARKLLGWSPQYQDLDTDISEVITREAKSLGLLTGHAAKVAG